MIDNKIKVINVDVKNLKEHYDIIKNCERLLPKGAKTTSINICFSDDCITTVCNFILNGIEDFQIIIWKERENES